MNTDTQNYSTALNNHWVAAQFYASLGCVPIPNKIGTKTLLFTGLYRILWLKGAIQPG